MTRPEVRLHDVTISGDVDRAAVLAAIERAVADASTAGAPTSESVRSAVSAELSSVVSESTTPMRTTGRPVHGDAQVG